MEDTHMDDSLQSSRVTDSSFIAEEDEDLESSFENNRVCPSLAGSN